MKQEGKAAAVISYITPLGWIIGYLIHVNKRAALSAWHLRQSLFLHLTSMLIYVLQVAVLQLAYIGWLLGMLLLFAGVAWLIFWAIGIIFAFSGEMRSIPVLGPFAQRVFKGLR